MSTRGECVGYVGSERRFVQDVPKVLKVLARRMVWLFRVPACVAREIAIWAKDLILCLLQGVCSGTSNAYLNSKAAHSL